MRALVRQVRDRIRGPFMHDGCVGHHWHYQSPFTHLTVRGSGWQCCNCPSWAPSSGPPPEQLVGARCAFLDGDSERLDRVERWLDALQPA